MTNQTPETDTPNRPADVTQPVPAALRIRVLRETLHRMEGTNADSASEEVDAATVRAVFSEMSAEMEHCAAKEPQTLHRNPDGSWTPAEPLPLTQDFDVEVYGAGPWVWTAHQGSNLVAQGRARTRLGLWFAVTRARIRQARR